MELLFSKGASITAYPIKCVYTETLVDMNFPAQAMFVAPKRNFKKSPDRNTLKRRMREVYRLNKQSLYEFLNTNQKKMILAFIYVGKKIEDYSIIEMAIQKSLKQISK